MSLVLFLVVNKTNTTSLSSSITSRDTRRINRLCIIYKSPDTRRYSGACSGAAVSLRIVENRKDLRRNVSQSRKVIAETSFLYTSVQFQNVSLRWTLVQGYSPLHVCLHMCPERRHVAQAEGIGVMNLYITHYCHLLLRRSHEGAINKLLV